MLNNDTTAPAVTGAAGVTFNGFVVVPEPGLMALSVLGGLLLVGYGRWRKR